jgi:hypothetical protein
MCSACPTSPPSSAAASPRPSSLGASGRKKTSSWACFGASPPVFLVPSEYRTNDWNRKFAIVSLAKTLREREVRRARAKVCVGRSVVPINPSSLLSTHQALLLACLSSTERRGERGEAAAAEAAAMELRASIENRASIQAESFQFFFSRSRF